jgi:hypothetical protein
MRRAVKILLGLCAGGTLLMILALVAIGVVVARNVETDAAGVAALAGRIADFQLPVGMFEEIGFSMAGWTAVTYRSDGNDRHLALIQGPAEIIGDRNAVDELLVDGRLDRGAVEAYAVERASANLGSRREWSGRRESAGPRTAGAKEVVIDGQPTLLRVREGLNSRGQPYREVSGVFTGKGGATLIVLTAPLAGWDEAALDAFISSIH